MKIDSDEYKKEVEELRSLKDHKGFKSLERIVSSNFDACITQLLEGGNDVPLEEVRADMRAWTNIAKTIDLEIAQYDDYVERMKQQQRLIHKQMGARNG